MAVVGCIFRARRGSHRTFLRLFESFVIVQKPSREHDSILIRYLLVVPSLGITRRTG
jgi:hypothetical protein